MASSYDLVVIGSGPAGESAAVTAALLGKSVAVVEKAPHPGGAAVNTGTLPSKTLRETAVALSGLRTRDLFGVDLSLRREATIDDFLRHERAVKVGERTQIRRLLDGYGVRTVTGAGAFADPHTVRVTKPDGTTEDVRGEKVVIAIGSVPVRPPGIPFDHNRVHDSDELLDLHELPRSIAVVGAGVIGCEYACTFAALGVDTHLIDGRDALLPFLDADLSGGLQAAMTRLGVKFVWKEAVTACPDPGEHSVCLTLSSGRTLQADHVLVCAGRYCKTPDLNPVAAGLTLADKGRVPVDRFYRTNVPHIYAVGDVIGFPALASTSGEQGRAAARHAFDPTHRADVAAVLPTGIYTIPEASAAGQTEAEVRKAGTAYLVGRAEYGQCPRGKIIGERDGFLKLIFRADDLRLLGVHVLGEMASEVVHIGVLALMQQAGADLFLRTCFNYPTLGELYKYATHDALQKKHRPGKS